MKKILLGLLCDKSTSSLAFRSSLLTYRSFYKSLNLRQVKLKVVSEKWADDVFDADYQAPTIAEIESYIAANKHLPGVPSAAEVAENGIDVANMSATLLRKIEELTLLVIEQNKTIEQLKRQIEK